MTIKKHSWNFLFPNQNSKKASIKNVQATGEPRGEAFSPQALNFSVPFCPQSGYGSTTINDSRLHILKQQGKKDFLVGFFNKLRYI
jgi:hypothetical protein